MAIGTAGVAGVVDLRGQSDAFGRPLAVTEVCAADELAGAAELSTGALCQLAIAGKGQFSMLVVDFRAEYHKKANQKITFTCDQGAELFELIDAMKSGETGQLMMISTGKNPSGEIVAKFYVTWSFKRKA